jgi:transcriptional regulator with XRE-family HTH domain
VELQVGRRIRELRKAKGLSLAQLAERADLNDKHLGLVERGDENLTLKSIRKIAAALDVPFADLFPADQDDERVVRDRVRKVLAGKNPDRIRRLRVFLEQVLP